MRIFAGGKEVDVPTRGGRANVVDVKRVAGIPNDRMLIQQKPNGGNTILPQNGEFDLKSSDRFMDAPVARRGK